MDCRLSPREAVAEKPAGRLRLGVEAGWLLAANICTFAVGLFAVRALTGRMTPVEYGYVALANSVVMFANQAIFAPVSNAASRFYAIAREKSTEAEYYLALLRMTAPFAAGACAVFVIAAPFLHARSLALLGAGTFVWALAAGLNSVLDGIQNAARQRIIVAIHQAAAQGLRLIAAVALVATVHGVAKPGLAMMGFAAGAGVVLVSQLVVLRHRELAAIEWRGATSPAMSAPMWTYGAPFFAWGLFTWLQQFSDRWALQATVSTHELGIYQSFCQIGVAPITNLFAVGMQLIAPVAFAAAGDGSSAERLAESYRLIHRTALAGAVATLAAVYAATLLREPMARLLLAPAYRTKAFLIPSLMLAAGTFGVGQTLTLKLMTQGSVKRLLAPKIGSAAVGCLLMFLLAGKFGVAGVAGAQILTALGYTVWVLALSAPQSGLTYFNARNPHIRGREIAPQAAR
jgi:O-antigen/teichoic acid export membrane protein